MKGAAWMQKAYVVDAKTRRSTKLRLLKTRLRRYSLLYLMILIPVAYIIIFKFVPIVYQVSLAFREYSILGGVFNSKWVGWENFKDLFTSRSTSRIFVNTIRISLLRLVCGFIPPIVLAIMLFDMTSKKIRTVSQCILYIPHFFSWVVIYGIVLVLFQNSGYVNAVIEKVGGTPKSWLMESSYFLPILIISAVWKELGWSTILYLAALTSINPELYEVARMDGAGPMQRIRYITLPGIRSIVVFVLTLNLGQLLSAAGTEQILLFYNATNYSISDTIGTWVYRQGLGELKYSLASAASMFESSVGFVLVLICNKLAVKFTGRGIW